MVADWEPRRLLTAPLLEGIRLHKFTVDLRKQIQIINTLPQLIRFLFEKLCIIRNHMTWLSQIGQNNSINFKNIILHFTSHFHVHLLMELLLDVRRAIWE